MTNPTPAADERPTKTFDDQLRAAFKAGVRRGRWLNSDRDPVEFQQPGYAEWRRQFSGLDAEVAE